MSVPAHCRGRLVVDPAQAPRRGALCCGRILSAPTAAAAEPPTGRLIVGLQMACTIQRTAQFRGLRADSIRPYSSGGEAAAIQRTAQLRTLREAKSLPYRTQKLSVFSVYVTGRVREPTCGYNPCASLSGGTAAALQKIYIFLIAKFTMQGYA